MNVKDKCINLNVYRSTFVTFSSRFLTPTTHSYTFQALSIYKELETFVPPGPSSPTDPLPIGEVPSFHGTDGPIHTTQPVIILDRIS